MAKKKKDKKNYWMKYGGHTSKMFPKANFGKTLGTIGDTNIAQNLNYVLPGLGTGVDFLFDYAGFRNKKKENKQKRKMGQDAYQFAMRQQDPDANKDTLNMDTVTSSAEGVSENMYIQDPSFAQDVLMPNLLQAGQFAMKGGFSKENIGKSLLGKHFQGGGNEVETLAKYGRKSYMNQGGMANQDVYEAEGGEVIQHNVDEVPGTTGNLQPVADNPMLSEIQGGSHSSGGELVDGGAGDQVVYSKTLKTDMFGKKMSFADAAKHIAKKLKSFEDAATSGDTITKNTANQMIQAWTVKMQELQMNQEKARKQQFQKMLSEGVEMEELAQNFPDLTQQFMQEQSTGAGEQELLGSQTMMYGGYPKYEYGSPEPETPIDPNDPPFFPRTDEEVDAMQNSFGKYGEGSNSFLIYGNDPGIQDYINSLPGGMQEFGDLWIQNVDPAILKAAGVSKFSDLQDQDKIRQLQIAYNDANKGKQGFTPIPVDGEGMGKFGEYTMGIATGWDELSDNATMDSPVNINDIDLGDITDPLADDDGIMEDEEEIDILQPDAETDTELEIGDIEDPLADDDGETEEEEDITFPAEEDNMGPERGPRDDMAPVATGDPLQDIGYQIQPDPELEFEELDIDDDDEEEEEIVYDQDGNVIYDPNAGRPQDNAITMPTVEPGKLTLKDYEGVKLPPNNQKNKKKGPPPYMGDAPYTDIVADNAGVQLEPGPGKKKPPTAGYFTGQDDGVDDIAPGMYDGDAMFYNRDILEDAAMYRDDVQIYDEDPKFKKPKNKREFNLGEGNEDIFNTGTGDGFNKKKKKRKEKEKKVKKTVVNDDENTNESRANAFGNLFNGKMLAPLYNFMKYNEGAEKEKKHSNPFESRIQDMANQKVDIQPWLNQNMSNLKTGMNFSKDFAGGSGLQMFNMYNRLNQGKNIADSEAWKYKRDKDIELQAQGNQVLYNLGEQERAEDIRVSDANLQNEAAADAHLKSALEQLSAIGQMDEHTRNLMQNDAIRMELIGRMAPDVNKYMSDNPGTTYDEALTALLATPQGQELMKEISLMQQNIGVATQFGNYQSETNTKLNVENEKLRKQIADLEAQIGGNVTGGDELLTDEQILGDNENPIDDTEIIVNDDINVDDPEIVVDDPIDTSSNEETVYNPTINADQQATLTPLTIRGTGPGAAQILVNGEPITATTKEGMVTVQIEGIRAEGDVLKVDATVPILGAQVSDFGEFVKDDSTGSGFKWVGDSKNYQKFLDNATAEEKAMFENFIAAVEGDVRYAEGVRGHIDIGEGDLNGTQLNDLIKNKPE